MAQVIALRHVAFEDLGFLDPLLRARGHRVQVLDAPVDDLSPLTHGPGPDLLVILGGPIGAADVEDYPFLAVEHALTARRIAAGKPTLGIRLGAQIIAHSLGSPIFPASAKEIGWAPLTLTESGRAGPLRHLDGAPVLHWHGDTFNLPEGADLLASTAACPHQAFAIGPAVLGLQFHAEAAGPSLERWLVGHCVEIAGTPGVSVSRLRADTAQFSDALMERGQSLFADWLAPIGL